jgi:DNA repair exonuclease SbcCD nuclease subunit
MDLLHAVVASDFHFEKLKRLFPYDHIERQIREIEKIYVYAIEKGIKHLFIPGDISDTYKMQADTYIQMLALFKKYDGLIHTYYIGGNHDFSDVSKTSMDLFSVLLEGGFLKTFHLFLQPEQLKLDGVVVNMMPHPCLESLDSRKPCLNFAHVEYTGAIGDNGRPLKTSKEFKSPKCDYTISGHIHKYQHLKSKRAIYCGTPYQTNFGESLPKGFIEIKSGVERRKMRVQHRFVDNKPGIQLLTEQIETSKDFARLSTEPGIRYRLRVAEGVIVPDNLMLENPNIAQLWTDKGKLEMGSEAEQFESEMADMPQIDPMEGLAKVFKSNGFTKKDYQRGRSLVQEALAEIEAK